MVTSKTKAKKADNVATVGYVRLRGELDTVLGRLQDPDTDVDDAVELYEQALVCITRLEHHLQQAENRVEKAKIDFGVDSTI